MVRRTGQQGVPVIAVDDQYIVGFDQPRIERALATAATNRPSLGAAVADAASVRLRHASVPESGAYVGRVRPGSPAAAAGLATGDVIVEVDGSPVSSAVELESLVLEHRGATPLRLAYLRNGERRTGQAPLA